MHAHVYYGNANHGTTEGIGLDDYLKSLGDVTYGEGLHDDIAAQLTSTATAIASLKTLGLFRGGPASSFFRSLCRAASPRGVVEGGHDVFSGVLITYQDNDGD